MDMKCDNPKCPASYLDWHKQPIKDLKTHKQVQCPRCGLWAVWRPRHEQEKSSEYKNPKQIAYETRLIAWEDELKTNKYHMQHLATRAIKLLKDDLIRIKHETK